MKSNSIIFKLKNHIFKEENAMHLFVIVMILFFFSIIWFWVKPSFYVAIGLTSILLISLYYQIMSIRYSVSTAMMQMKVEDKILNEMTYQTTKRGYTISFYYDENNKIRIKTYSCSKMKMRYIKFITFIHVIIKPAWWYHDDIDEVIE